MIALDFYLKKRNLTQTELARKSKVPQPVISDIINGKIKNPGVMTLKRICNVLVCTVDDLIVEDDEAS